MKAGRPSRPRVVDSRLSRRSLLAGSAVVGGASLLNLGDVNASPGSWRAAHWARFQDGEPQRGGTARVGLYIDAVTMDPHFSGSKVDRQIYFNVYDPLVNLGVDLAIEPGLAESWDIPDPTTYIFNLRQGVRFHDGTDFNAEAVKVNFDRMMDPDLQSLRRGEVAGIESVEVIDDYTVN
jgi:ABC-type transport system substrate-binding protein